MPRELVRRAVPVQRGEQLPAAYWPRLESVRVPGSPYRMDLVLVGPSGVQVVVDRPARQSSASMAPGDGASALEEAARQAASAAAAIADLLPARYRHTLAAAVRLEGETEVALTVGGVEAASPDVLRHMWRQRPRVLSTSEVTVVAGLLRHQLEPWPVDPDRRSVRWWRRGWRRWALVGAAAAAAVGGAAVSLDVPTPWFIP